MTGQKKCEVWGPVSARLDSQTQSWLRLRPVRMYGRRTHSTSASCCSIVPFRISYAVSGSYAPLHISFSALIARAGEYQSARRGKLTSHFETRSDFGELDFLVRRLDKDVMPERDKVAVVDKGQRSFRVVSERGGSRRQFENSARDIEGKGTDFGTGKMNLRTSRTRFPSLEPKPSKMRLWAWIGQPSRR